MSANALLADCPTPDQLRRMLSGELVGDDFASIETHIESCTACQAEIARLADSSVTLDWQPLAGTDVSAGSTTQEFLQRVKQRRPEADEIKLPPNGRLGPYEIQKVLGRGGMGVVFLARDSQLGHLVALKVLRPEQAAQTNERERFFREGRAAAVLKHENIVTVHAANSDPSFYSPYLVMEYVEGESLDQILKRQGPLPPLECARLVQQVAWGLAAAHDKNLVHRDMKPSNLMQDAATGRLKIMDFGLVRRANTADDSLTQAGHMVGTPIYMSPEHITAPDRVDARSDIFSVGVVLYEMMTGEKPFAGLRHMLLQQIVYHEPRAPRQLNDRIPRDLETICLKCLRKSPTERYERAKALADDLGRLLAGEPILARPVSRREKFWMWCRRNPWIAGSTAASVLIFVVAFAVVSWEAWSLAIETDIRRKAEVKADQKALAAIDAQSKEATARALEEEARKLTTQWAEGGLGSVEDVYREATQIKEPGTNEIKQRLLRASFKRLEGLPEATGQSGITLAATTLRYNLLMHKLALEIGETDKAWTHLTKAHDIARQRIKDQNNSTASRLNLADVCRDMAVMRRQSNRDMKVGLQYAQEAVHWFEDILASPEPELTADQRIDFTQRLSQAHSTVATTFAQIGHPAEALENYEKELAVRENILTDAGYLALPAAERQKRQLGFRLQTAVTEAGIGEMRHRLGQTEPAQKAYDECIATFQQLFPVFSKSPALKSQFVGLLSQAGNLFMLTGDLLKAARHFDRAIELGKELAAADSKIVEYRQRLGVAYFRRGILRQMQGDGDAAADFRACLGIRTELAQDASNVGRQRELLLILPRCGKHKEASVLADKLVASVAEPDPELLLDLARAFAQCSLAAGDDGPRAASYREKAIERLKQAADAGHCDPVSLEHEPDLAPLRTRPEFQTVVQQVRQRVNLPLD